MAIAGFQNNPDRSPFDDYPTHPDWTRTLLEYVKIRGRIWEPAAGDGAMVHVLTAAGHRVKATDLQRTGRDFTRHEGTWDGSIVTNPPYKLLNDFINTALNSATEQVALLTAIHALAGLSRSNQIFRPRPPEKIILIPRNMTVHLRDGKILRSQFAHCWIVWDQTHDGPTEFIWARDNRKDKM